MLRETFGVSGEWNELHSEKLCALYGSQHAVRVITSSIMRWAGHVARARGRRELHVMFWEGNLEKQNRSVDREKMLRVGLEEIVLKDVKWTDLAEERG